MKNKLNLGCGKDIKKYYTNLDIVDYEGVDIKHNLNEYPYPFENNKFRKVYCSHIFEHLEDRLRFMDELYRICKNRAEIIIKTPHWSHFSTYGNIQHKRGFSSYSFKGLKGERGNRFKIKNIKLHSKVNSNKLIGKIFDKISNFSHLVTELWLCKILPITEIKFVLEVKK